VLTFSNGEQHGLDSVLAHWPRSEADALAVQQVLRQRVVITDSLVVPVTHVVGVDVAYSHDESLVCAAAVVIEVATMKTVETQTAIRPCTPAGPIGLTSLPLDRSSSFPYVPGLFAFRELPAVLQALSQVHSPVGLVLCDGHGIAHPRRFGLASHLGVLCDLPAIGVGKTRLIGSFQEPSGKRGSTSELVDGDEVIGSVVRTQDNIKPVYVSIGHRIALETAVQWVLRMAPRYRLPETTRRADHLVNELRASHGS
jgi:deoxyribonuclease V